MNMTSENVDGVEHNVSTTSPQVSKHIVLGPLLNEGTALSVGRGSLIQWNPDMPGDDSPSYAMTCGCPFNWKSRIGHCELIWEWLKGNRREFMAAVTVTLTLVPTTVAFAFLAGVDPGVALTGSWIIALIAAIFNGRTGMIYCSAGSVAVVVVDIVKNKGIEYMFYAFILAGIITSFLAICKVANIMKMLPSSCMIGFVNGLAIVIFLSQLDHFTTGTTEPGPLRNFEVLKSDDWISGPELAWMLVNVALTMAVNWFSPYFRYTKKIPGAFLGIVMSVIFEWAIVRGAARSRTNTVEDVAKVSGHFPTLIWLDSDYNIPPLNGETFLDILPTAITIAAVSLIEVLMTVKLVDEFTESKGDPHKESFWLGIGNIVAGMFGGQGGNSEIGLTLINIHSGARLRVSATITAIFILLVIVIAYPVINVMPIAGLVGVMFVVILKIFEFSSMKMIFYSLMSKNTREKYFPSSQKISRMDTFIILTVTVLTPFTNLAIAVACGCGIAVTLFAWKSSNSLKIYSYCRSGVQIMDPNVIKVYEIRGPLFFGSVGMFLEHFDCHTDPELIELHFNEADIFDLSAIQAINTIGERYNSYQKRVRLRRIKNASLKVLLKANLLTDIIALEMEPNFEKPGPLAHLNVENYSESVRNRAMRTNSEVRQFIRQHDHDSAHHDRAVSEGNANPQISTRNKDRSGSMHISSQSDGLDVLAEEGISQQQHHSFMQQRKSTM